MYLSINFYLNNIYLYYKTSGPIICKNNFAYNLLSSDKYYKILTLLSNYEARDLISVLDGGDKLKLNINPMWGIKELIPFANKSEQPIKRNVLLPSIDKIQLIDNSLDLNAINCLCHDNTHITNIPIITININDYQYKFIEWTGNNQVWCSVSEDSIYYIYAYIYIFHTHTVLMISQTLKDPDSNYYSDLDFMSIYNHSFTQDEYGRFDCSTYEPNFTDIEILNLPINHSNPNINIHTESQCHIV